MINEQLLQYIKSQRDAGTSDEQIKENLSAAGWRNEDIAEGFEAVANSNKPSSQTHQEMRKEATEDRQGGQSKEATAANNQESQPTNQQDQYRESSEPKQSQSKGGTSQTADGKQAGSKTKSKKQDGQERNQDTGQQSQQPHQKQSKEEQSDEDQSSQDPSNQHSVANETPQELRTMEQDKQQFGGDKQAAKSKKQAKSSSSQKQKQEAKQKQPDTKKQHSAGNKDRPKQSKQNSQPKAEGQQKQPEQAKATAQDATTEGYHPTEARKQKSETVKEKKAQKSPQKQDRAKQEKQSTKKQKNKSTRKTKSTSRKSSRKVSRKKQKQRKSRIQEARNQSSSVSIAAIILTIIGLVLAGGGAAYAYLNYFQGPTAETNAKEVMQALAESGSFEYRVGIGRQAENGTANEETLVIEGAVDLSSQEDSYYTVTRPDQPGDSPVMGVASEFSEFKNLDPRQQQTVNQTLLQPEYFTVREFQTQQQLGSTDSNSGFATNRFGVMANPAQLFQAYNSIYETMYETSIPSSVGSLLQENLSGFEPQQGQLWVHPTSSAPYQITFIGTDNSGNNMQVNMQFRDHGGDITSAPRTYESRPVVSGLAEALGISTTEGTSDLPDEQGDNDTDDEDDSEDLATTTDTSQSTTTDESQSTTTDSTDESSDGENDNQQTDQGEDDESSDAGNQQGQAAQRFDQLRINDLQQLKIALQSYVNENGSYPANLNELASSQNDILGSMPTDPKTGNPYAYAVNQAQTVYHIGTTLEALSTREAPDDADYNSTTGSFSGGFDGSTNTCQTNMQRSGSLCYDLRGTVSSARN